MSDFQVTGTVEKVLPVEQVKEWQKGGIVIRTQDEYNNLYPLSAFGKAMDAIRNVKEGMEVTAHFNVRANEGTGNYEGRYFTNLEVWKVDVLSKGVSAAKPAKATPQEAVFESDTDDLPF